MPRFVVDKPIRTAGPRIVVEGGLEAGRHRFQLEVITADGRRSAPMLFTLDVHKPPSPNVTRPDGRVPRDVRPIDVQPIDGRPVAPAPARPTPVDTRQPDRIAPTTSGRPQRPIRRPGRGDHNPTE